LDGQPSELFLIGLQKLELGVAVVFSFLVGLRTYQHPRYRLVMKHGNFINCMFNSCNLKEVCNLASYWL